MTRIIMAGLVVLACGIASGADPTPVSNKHERDISNQEILEAGTNGDRGKIPLLRSILKSRASETHYGGAASNAQMALAKLGDQEQFQAILDELHSPHPSVQSYASKKLAYVGGANSIRALAELLTSNEAGKSWVSRGKGRKDRVKFPPPSHMAIAALSQLVTDGPKTDVEFPSTAEVQKWREWWAKNKEKYK